MKKLVFCLLALSALSCTPSAQKDACRDAEVKNVIYLIGDGMGLSQVTAAMLANGSPLSLQRAQYTGLQTTRSASSEVTDSAAGGTALATGEKTNNGVIGMDTLGRPLVSILKRSATSGRATGVVVTCSVTHATPASFVACNEARSNEEAIAEDYLTTRPDVFIGGGIRFFEKRADGRNLSEEMRAQGYSMLYSLDELKALEKGPVGVLLADNGQLTKKEGRGDELPRSTAEALRLLSAGSPEGFFLMVEGSFIDYGCHANDSAWSVQETLDFDRAVGLAMDFADTHPGTLVVVTADHETGGMTLPSNQERIVNGVALPGDGNHATVAFSTKGHTGSMVPVYAYGTGACRFTGMMDNTDVPKRIAELMKLQ